MNGWSLVLVLVMICLACVLSIAGPLYERNLVEDAAGCPPSAEYRERERLLCGLAGLSVVVVVIVTWFGERQA